MRNWTDYFNNDPNFFERICLSEKKVFPLHPVWKAFIKNYREMSRVCQITGKRAMGGNHVSHSKRRVKRTFSINLFKRNFYWPEEDRWIRLNVSAEGLRLINKIGLSACLKQATAAGLIKTV